MKICVAQTRPVKGDIQRNIDAHTRLIELASSYGAATIIFPELSLTGYEPALAIELATDPHDKRFDVFQNISDAKQITIGVGVPTRKGNGICISMVIFQPDKKRETYSKKYLHADEETFFVGGKSSVGLIGNNNIALAICYELSVPEHAEKAFKSGAKIYIASVAKTSDDVKKAVETLSGIAKKYSFTVLMSNCVGYCDNFQSAGNSSIWNNKGLMLAHLDDTNEGILIIDNETQEIIKKTA